MALFLRIKCGRAAFRRVAFAFPVAAALLASAASPKDPAVHIALLPLAAAQTDLPYAPLPTSAELAGLTATLRRSIEAFHLEVIPAQRVDEGVRAAGFDQGNVLRACLTVACAARIGHAVGATTVVIGTVTRTIGINWGTKVQVIAVPSGRQLGEYVARVLGDERSMQADEDVVAGCVARIVRAKHPLCGNSGDFWGMGPRVWWRPAV